MTAKLDAVTLEVLWTRIISVVDEAAKAIVRTSFSTLSNEANDFACVLTDARGAALAQNSGSIPSFIGTLPATVRHFLRELGAEQVLAPGDQPDAGAHLARQGDAHVGVAVVGAPEGAQPSVGEARVVHTTARKQRFDHPRTMSGPTLAL